MSANHRRIDTAAVHAGEPSPRVAGAAVLPIFQSTVFETDPEPLAGLPAREEGYHGVVYPRLTNLPNHVVLGRKLAALEGAEAGLVCASGMAAITTTLLTALGRGGHALVQDTLYGGTHTFLTGEAGDLGLSFDFIDATAPDTWADKVRPETRAIYTEAITNPTVRVADHAAVVAFARARGITSIIDSTFATPVNFRPVALGYDVAVHSATKYLNGHSDLVAGAVVGAAAWVDRIKHRLDHFGGSMDPHACFLLNRGLKTLALRVRQQNASALALAEFLQEHAAVAAVNYPGLASHRHHARARELFSGFGGMLSFELAGGAEAAARFVSGVAMALHAPSLGGVETLVTRPALTSHVGMSAAERARLGITDGLVRVSVGIEHVEDIVADFDHALGQAQAQARGQALGSGSERSSGPASS